MGLGFALGTKSPFEFGNILSLNVGRKFVFMFSDDFYLFVDPDCRRGQFQYLNQQFFGRCAVAVGDFEREIIARFVRLVDAGEGIFQRRFRRDDPTRGLEPP